MVRSPVVIVVLSLAFAQTSQAQDRPPRYWELLIQHPTGLKELEVTDSQMSELRDALRDIQLAFGKDEQELREQFKAEEINIDEFRSTKGKLDDAKAEAISLKASEVLTTRQFERAKQLIVWSALNSQNGLSRILLSDYLRKELEIDSKQAKEIEKVRKELLAEFNDEVNDLRKKYRKEFLKTLTPEQRDRFKELLGPDSSIYTMPAFF